MGAIAHVSLVFASAPKPAYYCTYSSPAKLICSIRSDASPRTHRHVNWTICKQFVRFALLYCTPPFAARRCLSAVCVRYNIQFTYINDDNNNNNTTGHDNDWSRVHFQRLQLLLLTYLDGV